MVRLGGTGPLQNGISAMDVMGGLVAGGGGNDDANTAIWDLTTGELTNLLRDGHSGRRITTVQFEEGGRTIVTGSHDRTLKMWDLRTGNAEWTLRGHTHGVWCFRWAGNQIVSGGWDKTIRLWDVTQLSLVKTLASTSGILSVAWNGGNRVVSGDSPEANIRVWDLQEGRCVRTIPGPREGRDRGVRCLQFDEMRLVSAGWDGFLRVFDFGMEFNERRLRRSPRDDMELDADDGDEDMDPFLFE
eukprot:TRINITY_DN1012_c0_g1_i2.p1 TRINITY_DN1012_c0_g1~~TRINITY_DN1012_c0_g1_i2.p1  ORF type:complete len:244 (-),score=43.16 TRINITY_DN1012_c0_g1_i2:113-844(-)